MDADDEVRDRATYFKAILEQHEASLNSQYILNSLAVSISSLEKSLHAYTLDQSAAAKPFDMKSVPAAAIEDKKPSASAATVGLTSKPDKPTTTATRHDMFVEKLAAVPELQQLNMGPLFRSEMKSRSISHLVIGQLSQLQSYDLFLLKLANFSFLVQVKPTSRAH